MTNDTKNLAATVAYMIGVPHEMLDNCFRAECGDVLDWAAGEDNLTAVRFLCKLRTALMNNFKETDIMLRQEMKNMMTIPFFDHENIKWLEKYGINIIGYNERAQWYMAKVQTAINEQIYKCEKHFEYIKFEYLVKLFYIPNCNNTQVMIKQFEKFKSFKTLYPFQRFIVWEKPEDVGSMLLSDRKFLKLLYAWNNDTFEDFTKYKDADTDTRNKLTDFVEEHNKTIIIVDCENSDPFKLYAMLQGMGMTDSEKIGKIVLCDDIHTTTGWDWVENFVSIPIEHYETVRILNGKSMVDTTLTALCCKECYQNQTDGFMLLSSDSDFYGLIQTLKNDAQFLVLFEYQKCSNLLKEALAENGTNYVALDDFCSASNEIMKRHILFDELERQFPYVLGSTPEEITDMLYNNTKIQATDKEKNLFCSKYICTLQMKLKNGVFTYEIQA